MNVKLLWSSFYIYMYIKSCCTPKINTILHDNYISIKKKDISFPISRLASASPFKARFYQTMDRNLKSQKNRGRHFLTTSNG